MAPDEISLSAVESEDLLDALPGRELPPFELGKELRLGGRARGPSGP